MKPILTNSAAIEFRYDENLRHSYFEVVFVEFGIRRRKAKKFPLGVSSVDLSTAVSENLPGTSLTKGLTLELVLWQCAIYEHNLYYIRTLLHDAKLHSFLVWLLDWYVQSFVASLVTLLMVEGGNVVRQLPEQIPEVLRTALQVSMLNYGEATR